MIAPLVKFIDWLSIQKDFTRIPAIDGRSLRLEEALQFLKGADFIPAESQPAKVEFNPDKSGLHFRFPTPRPSGFAENNVVYGRFYRCAERRQERPAIILLHGGNMMRGGNEPMTKEPIEELWQKWKQPDIWRLPHGHISKSLVPGLTGRVLRWLAPRLEAGRKNNA